MDVVRSRNSTTPGHSLGILIVTGAGAGRLGAASAASLAALLDFFFLLFFCNVITKPASIDLSVIQAKLRTPYSVPSSFRFHPSHDFPRVFRLSAWAYCHPVEIGAATFLVLLPPFHPD